MCLLEQRLGYFFLMQLSYFFFLTCIIVILCERQLRSSSHFCHIHDKTTEEELQKRPRSRSRSLSLSRSTSIPTLSKLFGAGGNSRSRSSSPARASRVAPTPSRSSPSIQNTGKVSSSEPEGLKNVSLKRGEKNRRPRSKSMVAETATASLPSQRSAAKASSASKNSRASMDMNYTQHTNGRRLSQDSQYEDVSPTYPSRHRRGSSAFKIALPDIDPYGISTKQDVISSLLGKQEGKYCSCRYGN